MNVGLVSAISGLSAFQQMLNVVGGNLANVNTPGYKTVDINFQDAISQVLQNASAPTGNIGSVNPQELGVGVQVGSIESVFSQGSLNVTGNNTDLAINGNGFFVLQNADGSQSFTRDGNFDQSSNGALVNAQGLAVEGWTAAGGTINTTTAPAAIILPVGQTAAQATTAMTMGGNLDASSGVFSAGPPAAGGQFTSQAQIFDSEGNSHTINFTFTNTGVSATTGEAQWSWSATADSSATAGSGIAAGSGTLSFNSSGDLDTANSSASPALSFTPANGAAAVSVALNFGSVTQLAASSGSAQSTVTATSQNGSALGTLQTFTVGDNGVITGSFSNGLQQSLGQVALATFSNNQGLVSTDNGNFSASAASGNAITNPQTAGAGTITSGALEASNVDLGTQFTNMIIAQRAFEANSKMITTIDQVLGELANLRQG